MYRSSSFGAGAGAVLMLVAFIGAIVCTYLGYKRYVSEPGERLLDLRDERTLRSFLRFDTLLIDRILKVLYLFNAIFVPFCTVALALTALFSNFTAGLVALITGTISVVVIEILLRLGYEALMLNVILVRNTRDIKRAMGIEEAPEPDLSQSALPEQTAYGSTVPSAPMSPAGMPYDYVPGYVAAPIPSEPSAPSGWTSVAQATPPEGWGIQAPDTVSLETPAATAQHMADEVQELVCPNCGAPLRTGAKFCGSCGLSLR